MQEHAEFAGNDSRDPRSVIASGTMGRAQILVLALTVALNALDGFDVLSISFASPGIAQAWGVDRAALGVVLAMELIGMAVGSIFIGNASDRFGRRPVVLACLVLMTVSMFLASGATSIVDLAIWRVVTGLGIGGMLDQSLLGPQLSINARWRDVIGTRFRYQPHTAFHTREWMQLEFSVELKRCDLPLAQTQGLNAARRA